MRRFLCTLTLGLFVFAPSVFAEAQERRPNRDTRDRIEDRLDRREDVRDRRENVREP